METQQMIEVVQAYIFHRKNEDVKIKQPTNTTEFLKLTSAYATAVNWFNANGSIKFFR